MSDIIKTMNPDILCLQEHWLHDHDYVDIKNMIEGRSFQYKAVDVSEQQENKAARSSKGGVLTCWSNEMNSEVTCREADSTDRIIVTCFNLKRKICIINCYLASGNTADAYEKYSDDLCIISDTILKYEE